MEFSVLQWNVWFKEQAKNVVDVLQQADAGILCLQELTTDSFVNKGVSLVAQIEALGYHVAYHETLRHAGKNYYKMGNAICSRWPIAAEKTVYVQYGNTQLAPENRVYVEVKIDTPGGLLTVGTTHLSYYDELLGSAQIATETDALMSAIAHHEQRYIFTGDLNATPSSYPVAKLSEHFAHAGPNLTQPTWTTKPYPYHQALDRRIDYVFATADLPVLGAATVTTDASDHLPILVRFNLTA